MSFFGMGGGLSRQEEQEAMYVEQATREMTLITDMYNRMVNVCWEKCISRYNDPSLTLGEGTCTDRCVKKYLAVQQVAAKKLGELQQQQQQM